MREFRWPGLGLSAGHSPGGGAGCPAVAHWPHNRNGSTLADRWTQKKCQANGWLYLENDREGADDRQGSRAYKGKRGYSCHVALRKTFSFQPGFRWATEGQLTLALVRWQQVILSVVASLFWKGLLVCSIYHISSILTLPVLLQTAGIRRHAARDHPLHLWCETQRKVQFRRRTSEQWCYKSSHYDLLRLLICIMGRDRSFQLV